MLIHDIRTYCGITHVAWMLKKARWERSQLRRRNDKRIAARSVMLALNRATAWRITQGLEVPF